MQSKLHDDLTYRKCDAMSDDTNISLSALAGDDLVTPFQIEGIGLRGDRKSTRLNSSHDQISYAVFCLKKKNNTHTHTI